MKPIADAAKNIAPSATLSIDALAKKMKADGLPVIGFGAGEPDFNTPEHIKDAGIAAIRANQTRYTPSAGILPLREAICDNIRKNFGISYTPDQIVVSSGAKHNLYIAMQTLFNPGDEVILPAPYWVSYEEAIKMTHAIPVIVETSEEDNFKMTPEMLRAAITDRTKCVVLTNPSNPTGMVYSGEELRALAEVIREADLYVISDEIYHVLTYRGEHVSIASLDLDMQDRTIFINGVSKTYAMTGWRVGYAAARPDIAKVMSNYLSHSTGSACNIAQYAALEAYRSSDDEAYRMRDAFDERRRYFVERVRAIDGVSCLEPDGAFYIFMNIKPMIGQTLYGKTIENSGDFASLLLEKALVAVVPGTAFGVDGYLRWSYATSMDNIREGLDRLEKFLRGEEVL